MSIVSFGPPRVRDGVEPDVVPELGEQHDFKDWEVRQYFKRVADLEGVTSDHQKRIVHEAVMNQLRCEIGQVLSLDEKRCVDLTNTHGEKYEDTQNVHFTHGVSVSNKGFYADASQMEQLVFYEPADTPANMRRKMTIYRTDYLQSSGQDFLMDPHAGYGGACPTLYVRDDATQTYALRPVLFYWQQAAVQHVRAVCDMHKPEAAVLVNHGTGTGKTTIIGTLLVQLLQPSAAVSPNQIWIPWVFVNHVDNSDHVAKICKTIASRLPQATVDEMWQRYLEQANAQTRAALQATPPPMDERIKIVVRELTRFGANKFSFVPEEQIIAYDSRTLAFNETVFTERLKRVFNARKMDKMTAHHVIMVDECHFLLNTEEGAAVLQSILGKFKGGLPHANVHQRLNTENERLRAVLFTATPSAHDQQILDRYVSLVQGPNSFSVTRFSDIPRSLRTRIGQPISISALTEVRSSIFVRDPPGTYSINRERTGSEYFWTKKIPSSVSRETFPTVFKNIEAIMSNYISRVILSERLMKVIIAVPDAYIVDATVDGEAVQQVTHQGGQNARRVYDVLKESIRTMTWSRLRPDGHIINIQKHGTQALVGDPRYRATFAFFDDPEAALFGDTDNMTDLERDMGAQQPQLNILFINEAATGKSYPGVSVVYFAHRARSMEDDAQLRGRGVRICSSFLLPENENSTTIVYSMCEPPNAGSVDALGQYVVDDFDAGADSPSADPEVDANAIMRRLVTEHNSPFIRDGAVVSCVTLETRDEVEDYILSRDLSGPDFVRFVFGAVWDRKEFPYAIRAFLRILAGKPKDGNRYPVRCNIRPDALEAYITHLVGEFQRSDSGRRTAKFNTLLKDYIILDTRGGRVATFDNMRLELSLGERIDITRLYLVYFSPRWALPDREWYARRKNGWRAHDPYSPARHYVTMYDLATSAGAQNVPQFMVKRLQAARVDQIFLKCAFDTRDAHNRAASVEAGLEDGDPEKFDEVHFRNVQLMFLDEAAEMITSENVYGLFKQLYDTPLDGLVTAMQYNPVVVQGVKENATRKLDYALSMVGLKRKSPEASIEYRAAEKLVLHALKMMQKHARELQREGESKQAAKRRFIERFSQNYAFVDKYYEAAKASNQFANWNRNFPRTLNDPEVHVRYKRVDAGDNAFYPMNVRIENALLVADYKLSPLVVERG